MRPFVIRRLHAVLGYHRGVEVIVAGADQPGGFEFAHADLALLVVLGNDRPIDISVFNHTLSLVGFEHCSQFVVNRPWRLARWVGL